MNYFSLFFGSMNFILDIICQLLIVQYLFYRLFKKFKLLVLTTVLHKMFIQISYLP